MKKLYFTIILAFNYFVAFCQRPEPASIQSNPVLIKNAFIHIGNGNTIQKGDLLFENGIIQEVSNNISSDKIRPQTTIIDASGKHIYPGFIATNISLGLSEIEAVRATNDYYEVGLFNPNINAEVAFYTDSKVIPTVRSNGILLAQTTPRGGIISGNSSVMHLDAWNYEDAIVKSKDGIHLNWPNIQPPRFFVSEEKELENKSSTYEFSVQKIHDYLLKASIYQNTGTEKDLRLEAMKDLFNGKSNLYIHANYYKEISDAIATGIKFGIKKIVIVGGSEADKAADLLIKHNVSVVLQRTHSLPPTSDSDVDYFYKLPSLLNKKGVLFCLQNSGDMEAMGARNLPFLAGTAWANGLSEEQAIETITLSPAKILGIDNKYGSLEKGKSATLIISDGNALEVIGNNITDAFIDGRKLNLHTEQKELYERYKRKYGIK